MVGGFRRDRRGAGSAGCGSGWRGCSVLAHLERRETGAGFRCAEASHELPFTYLAMDVRVPREYSTAKLMMLPTHSMGMDCRHTKQAVFKVCFATSPALMQQLQQLGPMLSNTPRTYDDCQEEPKCDAGLQGGHRHGEN